MSLDLQAIHEALADQIRGYIADDWNVSAYPGSGMELPLIEVQPGPGYVQPWGTMTASGVAEVSLTVRIEIVAGDAETNLARMARALSIGTGHTTSVVDAVMSDRTLSGAVSDLIAAPKDEPIEWASGDLFTVAEVPVRVYVRKEGARV